MSFERNIFENISNIFFNKLIWSNTFAGFLHHQSCLVKVLINFWQM